MPVVAMEDLRRPPQSLATHEHRAGQSEKTQVLVRVKCINRRAGEEGGAVDQIDGRGGARHLSRHDRECISVGPHFEVDVLEGIHGPQRILVSVDR